MEGLYSGAFAQQATDNPSRGKKRKQRALCLIVEEYVLKQGKKASCRFDLNSDCTYVQSPYDVGNFIRHCRTKHTELAVRRGLTHDLVTPQKKRVVHKRLIAVDKQLLVGATIKLVAYHNLPLECFAWEGMRQLLEPLAAGNCINLTPTNIKLHQERVADRIRHWISVQVQNKVVSLKIDSAWRAGRHVLIISINYVFQDEVVVRTLGMFEITEPQTAGMLKAKVTGILKSYNLTVDQLFSVTCVNGANLLAADKQENEETELPPNARSEEKNGDLARAASKQEMEEPLVVKQEMEDSQDSHNDESIVDEQFTVTKEDPDELANCYFEDINEEQDKLEHELVDALGAEFGAELRLVSAIQTLQQAILDVVKKSIFSVQQVTDVAKRCSNIKFKPYFELHGATVPPVGYQTRWGGVFKMMQSFCEQESFFKRIALQYPELDLSNAWEFIGHFVQAFSPLYECTGEMQTTHLPFPDFYIQWLMAVKKVKQTEPNPFASQLTESLTTCLTNLRTYRPYRMALFLDPRFNYALSKLFNSEEKEQIQNNILDTWHKISKHNDVASGVVRAGPSNAPQEDEFDDFLTELLGGSLPTASQPKSAEFLQQLKAVEVEPRQTHSYNVFNHWVLRKQTHPELYAVAMVVLATPANHVSAEKAASALALVTNSQHKAHEADVLSNTVLIKFNKKVFEFVMPSLYNWNDLKADP